MNRPLGQQDQDACPEKPLELLGVADPPLLVDLFPLERPEELPPCRT